MTSERDRELQDWMESWTDGPPAPAEEVRAAILRRVRRQSFYQRLWAALEAVVAVGMAVFLVAMGARPTHPSDIPVIAAFGLLLGATMIWGWLTRKGMWRTTDDSTAAFLDLSLRRCSNRLKLVRGGFVILALEILIFVPWLRIRSAPPWAFAYLAGMVALAIVALLVVGGRTHRDLESLAELERKLEAGSRQ
jgi:hypothetical protein